MHACGLTLKGFMDNMVSFVQYLQLETTRYFHQGPPLLSGAEHISRTLHSTYKRVGNMLDRESNASYLSAAFVFRPVFPLFCHHCHLHNYRTHKTNSQHNYHTLISHVALSSVGYGPMHNCHTCIIYSVTFYELTYICAWAAVQSKPAQNVYMYTCTYNHLLLYTGASTRII